MDYKLTEDQSLEVYTELKRYIPIIKKVNEVAYDIIVEWHGQYLKNNKFWFKPLSLEKFANKLGSRGKFYVSENYEGYKKVFADDLSALMFDADYLRKKNIEYTTSQIQSVWDAAYCPHLSFSTQVVNAEVLLKRLEKYANIPYTFGSEEMQIFENIQKVNLERLVILERLGINVDDL